MLFEQPVALKHQTLVEVLLEGENPKTPNIGGQWQFDPKISTLTKAIAEASINANDFLEIFKEELDEVLSHNFNTITKISEEVKQFNENALVFQKSAELLKVENILSGIIDDVTTIPMNIVSVKNKIKDVESILETYFGFGSLTLAIEALGGFQLVMQSLGLLSVKGKTIEKFEKGKERKLNAAELEMVNEHFKKEFGKIIDSTVTMNAGNVNAFTLKKDIFSNVKHQLNVDTVNITDGKISWKEEIKPATYIGTNLSLFTLPNVTGGQVLSVILHEIGHCFYQGSIISRCISTIFSAMLTIPMIIMKIINKVESLTFSVIGKSTILTEIVNIVYGSVLSFLNIYCSFMNLNLTEVWSRIFPNSDKQTPQALMNALKLSKTVHILYKMIIATAESGSETVSTIFRAFANPMVVLKIIGGDVLTEEKYCDNFAAAHGYGPDLSQALTTVGGGVLFDKTHDSEKDKLSKIQRTSLVLGYLNVLLSEIQHLADEHPNLTSRPLFIADYYKEELKKTNDPKTKAYIEKLIVDSLKATTQYRLANKKLKDDMKRIALDTNDNTGIFDKFNSSAFDRLKNAVSIDTGSLNNLQTRIGHSTGAN